MARLPHLDEQDLPAADQHLLARPIGVHRVLANLPELLRGVTGIGDWVRWHTELDSRLRELAIVYVGALCGSPYEYSHHVKIAQEFGATPQDLDDLARLEQGEPTSFGELELLVLHAARQLTLEASLPDASWDALTSALGIRPAAELVSTVAYYGMIVRLLAGFAVEVEPEYRVYLERFPPPRPPAVASAASRAVGEA